MKRQSVVRTIAGILALIAVPAAGIGGHVAADSASTTPPATPVAEAVVGTGPWLAKFICAGCVAGAIAAGGSSVIGFLALAGAHGAILGACAGACTVGFG